MSAAWTLVKNEPELVKYRQAFEQLPGMPRAFHGRWSPPPARYPVLVSSIPVRCLDDDGSKLLSAYVYPEDATRLLAAAKPAAAKPVGPWPEQNDFNRFVAAHLMTLVSLLERNRLVTQENYERHLTANTAVVDRYIAADAAARRALMAAAQPGEESVLPGLMPEREG